MNIKEQLRSRIEGLGHNINEFDDMHYDAFVDLSNNDIEITDNLLNPKIDSIILGVYVGFIVGAGSDKHPEFIKCLPYMQPGMNLNCMKNIQEALEANDEDLLNNYVELFATKNLSIKKRYDMVDLIKIDAPYKHLANPAYSDAEAHKEMQDAFDSKFNTTFVNVNPKTGKYETNE